jgi:hypothetical protein
MWLRQGAKLTAAYQQALKPRLLVLVAMAATLGAYNQFAEEPLPLVYQGCTLGGFLSYKIALLLELFQQNTVKVRGALRRADFCRAGQGAARAARRHAAAACALLQQGLGPGLLGARGSCPRHGSAAGACWSLLAPAPCLLLCPRAAGVLGRGGRPARGGADGG